MSDVFTPQNPIEMECPECNRVWTPTPYDDCLLPACGCYGDKLDRDTPCESCGLSHGWTCPKIPGYEERRKNPNPQLIERRADGTEIHRGRIYS